MTLLAIIGAALLALGWPVVLTARDAAAAFFGVIFAAGGTLMLIAAGIWWLI